MLGLEQNVILLGMMADASDECVLLTRFMDRDTFDIGFTHAELRQFQERISHLFLSKACLACGYTQVALEFLKRPRVLHSPALRTIGSHTWGWPSHCHASFGSDGELGDGHQADL